MKQTQKLVELLLEEKLILCEPKIPYILAKEAVEWTSSLGTKTEEGYVIKSCVKAPYPLMSREQVREFAQYILNVTTETTYRGV